MNGRAVFPPLLRRLERIHICHTRSSPELLGILRDADITASNSREISHASTTNGGG